VFTHARRITTAYSKAKLNWKRMGTLVLSEYNWEDNEPAR
jgi:hypothetical protein